MALLLGGCVPIPAGPVDSPPPAVGLATARVADEPGGPLLEREASPTPGPSAASGVTFGSNASPIGEPGSVWSSIATGDGSGAAGVAFDPSNGWVYVSEGTRDQVAVLNGTRFVGNVSVGSNPGGLAYDPATDEVFVADTGAPGLDVVRDTTVIATIASAALTSPYGIAFDPSNEELYVTNVEADTVAVIAGGTVAASIPVGEHPAGIAYDPLNHGIYVVNSGPMGGNNLSLIVGDTVVATIGGPFLFPQGIAFDPSDGLLCVTGEDSNVTFVNGTAVAGQAAVGRGSEGVAYDPINEDVYVANLGSGNVSILRNGTVSGSLPIDSGPSGLAYAPTSGTIYVASPSSGNITIVATALSETPPSMVPGGRPSGSADVGQPFDISTTLWAPGASPDAARVTEVPSVGLGCPTTASLPPGVLGAAISLACLPTAAGRYSIWINVTDHLGRTVWGLLDVEIFDDPTVGAPALSSPQVVAGTFLNISLDPSGGTGEYTISWRELPLGCSGASVQLRCAPTQAGLFNISANATDGNGWVAVSPSSPLEVTLPSGPNGTNPNGSAPPRGGGTAAPTIAGLDPPTFYTIVVSALVAVAAVVVIAWRGRSLGPRRPPDAGS